MEGLRTLNYCPELNRITGSVTASLLLAQLEYWFEKTHHKTFYKFLTTCEDSRYKKGDSWTEELGFSKTEFRNAFSKIGKVYKSKTAYLSSSNKFEGKLYLSYYDRSTNLTYYMRNTRLVNRLLANQLPSVTNTKDYKQKTKSKTQKNTIPYDQMIALFHNLCPSLEKVTHLTHNLKVKLTILWNTLKAKSEDPLELLTKCFKIIENSDFLCGRSTTSNWRALFAWIIQPDKFWLILSGKYNRRTLTPPPSHSKSRFTRMYEHGFDIEALEAKERAHQEERYAQSNLFVRNATDFTS